KSEVLQESSNSKPKDFITGKGEFKCQRKKTTLSKYGKNILLVCIWSIVVLGMLALLSYENESCNKYNLAQAESSRKIIVQDYNPQRDASKTTQALVKIGENGNIPPDIISKDERYKGGVKVMHVNNSSVWKHRLMIKVEYMNVANVYKSLDSLTIADYDKEIVLNVIFRVRKDSKEIELPTDKK
ncbi:unnamed protein product, partial [Meganyctiphanes norvegica]